jgi:NAD(P)-dependent dehydrogenase (short-subunit alcohol dehydrogenase family)
MVKTNSPRTVIVTGSSRGIGADIGKYFYEQGDYVIFSSRNNNGITTSLGERARFMKCDVCISSDHARLVDEALSWTGKLDVYINNAGESHWMPLDQITDEFWQAMIDVNAKSVLFGSKHAAHVMQAGSSIINISSLAGKRGSANNSVYCAGKFAVNGITQSLAKELGPRGIRVNAICPVLVATPGLIEALADPAAPSKGDAEKFLQEFKQNHCALANLPTAKEVAQFCYALVNSNSITGQCINVDSGVFPQ